MGKKSKKCSSNKSRRIIWYAISAAGMGSRAIIALALVVTSIKIQPLKYQSELFNTCVEEIRISGKAISESVRICNGGDLWLTYYIFIDTQALIVIKGIDWLLSFLLFVK